MAINTTDRPTRVSRAAGIWADQEAVEQEGHAAYFARNGFTVIPGLLNAEEVSQCVAELDRITKNAAELPNVRVIGKRNPLAPSCDLEDVQTESGSGPAIRKITGFGSLSPLLWRNLIEHPHLIDVLHSIFGERVELYRDALMLKSAGVGQEKPWHQDAVYWPFRPMRLASAMIALDSSTPENGCLQVIPGSHRAPVEHMKIDWELQVDPARCQPKSLYMPLNPGDCLVFHSLMLHASEHNLSPQSRRVSITSYSPGRLEILDPEINPPVLLSERKS
jgi:phytanoyl-CoA hydroxylase